LSSCQFLVGASGLEPESGAYKVPALTLVLRAEKLRIEMQKATTHFQFSILPGASGGQRSRSLRGVGAALCRLSYAGLVGRHGFEP
jgi:hypothetical protein